MPTYDITSPEGKKYRVTAPDGATKDDALAYVQKTYTAEPAQRGPLAKLLGIGGERYQTWPERFVRDIAGGITDAAKSGAELTKGALAGQFGPTGEGLSEAAPEKILSASSLGLSGAPGAAKALAAPVAEFGESLARTYPEKLQDQAVKKVLSRFEQDAKSGGPTAQQALDSVKVANLVGKPMTLADTGGKNVERLAGNVYRQGGEGTQIADQFLQARDEGSAQRLAQDISKYVHGGSSMHKTTEALLTARSEEGKPLWEQVRSMQGVWSPRLQQFIDDRVVRAGMARGYEIERLESLAEGRPFNPTQMGIDLDAEGNIKIIAAPNMRVLHMGKMGLDAMIADERNEITGRLSQRGVALERVRQAYLHEIDSLDTTGIYKQARGAWEGRSKSLDAIREGRTVFNNSPEENAATFAKLSPADQEFYRIGVADILRERLAKTGLSGDEAKSIIKNPWVRDQLKTVFRSPKEFDAFVDSVAAESRMFSRNVSIRRGSQTAERLAEDQSSDHTLAIGGAEIAKSLAGGEWLGAIRKYIAMKRDLGMRQNPELNERIAKLLFSTDPQLAMTNLEDRPNYLAGPASLLQAGTPALIPGGAATLLAPGGQ